MNGWFARFRANAARPATFGEALFLLCIMPAVAIGTFMLLVSLVGHGL